MTQATVEPADEQISTAAASGRGIAIAALLLMVGNLASRVFGLIRESVIGRNFTEAQVSLFGALSTVPTQFYDLLVGGLVSAALVPVLSDYLEQGNRKDFWELLNTVLTLVLLALCSIGSLLALGAPLVTQFIATDLVTPENMNTAVQMLYAMIGTVILMGISGLLTGLLQAQQRFLLPAFTTSIFNIGVIAVIFIYPQGSALILAIGMLVGAAGQVLLQLPGLRQGPIRPQLRLRHPGVRQIGWLYAPVALGMSFSFVGTIIDRRLASSDIVGEAAIAYMRWATNLIQFTLGMVAAAISLAILPTLARLNSANDQAGFRRVFAMGLKTVVLLVVPAMILLAVLGEPIIRLIFEGDQFSVENTRITASVLLTYLPSLLAAAVDQPLIFAFYARKQTLLPNLVQGVAIAAYCIVAFATYRVWGMYGLVAANVVQWIVHALMMIILGHRRLGIFSGQQFGRAWAKIGVAACVMLAACWSLAQLIPDDLTKANALLHLLVAGGGAGIIYLAVLWWLRLEALVYLGTAFRTRFNR